MRFHRSVLGLATVASLLLLASLALAEDAPSATPPGGHPGAAAWCKENPGKCEEARAKHAAFCKENPEKCEQMKAKRAERAEFCKQNPQKCDEQREKMQQHHAEMKAKCEADPAKCEEMKQQRRERFMKRHGGGAPGNAGAPPANAPGNPTQ